MNIAELFVKLGVKGESSTGKSLKGIDKGLENVKARSIATKAAILGVVYGLERMMSNSAQMGTGLKQFSDATGLSTKTLQVWQHAGRKFSVAENEITGAFSGIQKAMMDMIATGNQPAGMSVFANAMKIDPKRLKDTEYMMDKLQEYMQTVSASEARLIGGSFGFSDAMIGSMRKGAFSAQKIVTAQKEANIYSRNEINNLQKIESKWAQIGHNIKMAMGRLVADQGLEFAKPIEDASAAIVIFTGHVLKLLKKTEALTKVATVFKNMGNILQFIGGISEAGDRGMEEMKQRVDAKKNLGASQSHRDRLAHMAKKAPMDMGLGFKANRAQSRVLDRARERKRNSTSTVNNKTSITINEAKTPKETSSEVMKGIQAQYRNKDNGQES